MSRNERQSEFKKTVDGVEGRRRRTETTLAIRKDKREQQLKKKRGVSNDTFMDSEGNALSYNEQNDDTVTVPNARNPSVNDIPNFKSILDSPTASNGEKIEATKGVRRLLSFERNPYAAEIISQGILPILVRNLKSDQNALVFESAWALTNIASTDRTKDVIDAQAVPILISLMEHDDSNNREQAIWCLGNIAGEGAEMRDELLRMGIVQPLLKNVEQPASMTLLGNAVWVISNLSRGKPAPDRSYSTLFIDPLMRLLGNDSLAKEVYVDIFWALSYLSDGDNDQVELVMRTGVVSRLIEFLKWNTDVAMLVPVVRILGNFVSGTGRQTQQVLDAGILDHLGSLLRNAKKTVQKESCWLASNIAAGTVKQISALIETEGVLELLVDRATNGQWDIRKEAIWALSNICTAGSPYHIQRLVKAEGLQPLVMILALENADSGLLETALDAIGCVMTLSEEKGLEYERLIDEYNGVDYLDHLQNHPCLKVYAAAVKLIEAHFGDEEEDENLAPQTNGTTFDFGFSSPMGLSSPKQLFPTGMFNATNGSSVAGSNFAFGSQQDPNNCSPV